jgi:hypothetical protein
MKRILIAILCGAALVGGYFLFLAVLYQIYPVSFDTLRKLLVPLNFPYEIYKRIFGPYYGSPTEVKILNSIAAVLIYSVPFYLGLTFLAKMRKNSVAEKTEKPPEPPIFERY